MSLRVLYVAPDAPEEDAAWQWLDAQPGLSAQRAAPSMLLADPGGLERADVIWVHATDPLPRPVADVLPWHLRPFGGVLLTLHATALVEPLGLEAEPPDEVGEAEWRHEADPYFSGDLRAVPAYPHVRGLAAYGPHPLFDGLPGGTFCWAPSEGERHAWSIYRVRRPSGAGAGVVAVERAYVTQAPDRVVAWEYERPHRVLCVGALVHFSAPDPLLRPQLERLVRNAFGAVTDAAGPRSHWPRRGRAARADETLALPEPLDLDGALPDPAQDPLALEHELSRDTPFDLAGRRALLVGEAHGGERELWMHPHRVLAACRVACDGEGAVGTRLSTTPDVVVRTLETAGRKVTETQFVALEHPVALFEWHATRKGRESVGRAPADFAVSLLVDLQRQWPFGPGAAGGLRFRRSAHGMVAVVAAEGDGAVCALFLSRPAEVELRPAPGIGRPAVSVMVRAPLGMPLRLAVVGAPSSGELDRTLRAVSRLGVAGLVRQRTQRATTLREARISLHGGDAFAGVALEWAKRRLDAFLGEAPGVGRSLLAGFAPSRPGFNAARPGYAWFFGRDACWSAIALLASGEQALPRQVVRFLGESQDVTGKVPHEVTTSGQFHYDAADATPLYLLLVARYLAWTGDVEFVRTAWPRVARALAFCLSTDRDGDGLIENTRVGHGWVEAGALGGAHVELYLAAVWQAALAGLARVAEVLGDAAAAEDLAARASRARAAIETGFHDHRRGYAFARRADGTRVWSQTALHAVPLLLGVTDPERSAKLLGRLAGGDLATPWGVRMLGLADPHFDPAGYHAGAVWPLFTGWASLALYRCGRPEAGLAHLLANARLIGARQPGAFDEVLHGLTGDGAGVCPDQAWSAAALVSPVVEGLFGVEPDAPAGRLTIAPALPPAWPWMEARGLRCGETVFDTRLRRRGGQLTVSLRRTLGPPLWLTVAPWLPVAPSRVLVNEQEVTPRLLPSGTGVRAAVSFQAGAEDTIELLAG